MFEIFKKFSYKKIMYEMSFTVILEMTNFPMAVF